MHASQETPLQLQLNSPSSAASPPFTSTDPVMHNGDPEVPLASSSTAPAALLTSTKMLLQNGDLRDASLPLISRSMAPASKLCFTNTLGNFADGPEDFFSVFSSPHIASHGSSVAAQGPVTMLQTAGGALACI